MNYYGPFLTLLFSAIGFHILLIKYFPQNKRFWKKVDYAWVSLGIIGIFGASFSLQKEYVAATNPLHKYSLNFAYDEYVESIRDQKKYFLDKDGFDYNKFEDKQQVKKFLEAGKFYDSLLDLSILYKDKILVKEEFAYVDSLSTYQSVFLDKIDDKYIIDNFKFVDFSFIRIKEEAKEIKAAEEKAARGSFNWMLLFISPYLFALAISIRITKVTAELKEIS
ncbi:hypothetical protein FLA105534_00900 [Flavobacterium bizetiae]|uniref:Uncharacterized protein n=1 Tax=Flavobacterium bizetiae TaxID=2704140 RepID=A0A6J4GDD6_9FLAO|nr:hypothetical protein [Flavobacterium bizetiae]CAA9196007.1 hypothetical protein FLA105534_00900 [Flavobacterium bizetiae]CAD5343591.1 hypothetical protein FLA105535_03591 [Flavobacterium bizetiae]CAD5349586.1 hypothetical protein FLA105534_03572 [Flavobacterium bizetiae]